MKRGERLVKSVGLTQDSEYMSRLVGDRLEFDNVAPRQYRPT